jgi:probable phosphoglycerate mutase
MQTDLLLVRHGETVWNAQARFQGHQNSPLTSIGHAQAAAAAAYLRDHTLHALYSSDLPRTLQTAQPTADVSGLTIIEEPALRERNLGIFEALTRAEIEAKHRDHFARYVAREPHHVIPNGESLYALNQRGLRIMTELARRHPGEQIVVVSHGAFITTFLRHLHGIELHQPSPFTIANGSISHVRYDHRRAAWTIVEQGKTLHSSPVD